MPTPIDELKEQGYTDAEIEAAQTSIVPANEIASGMPLNETTIKSTYILSYLGGASSSSGGGGLSSNLLKKDVIKFWFKTTGSDMSTATDANYTINNGPTYVIGTRPAMKNFDLSNWKTALVIIRSAGGSGAYSLCNPASIGMDMGYMSINRSFVLPLYAGEPSLSSSYSGRSPNRGGEGRELAFMVDVSNISTIDCTIGEGGASR